MTLACPAQVAHKVSTGYKQGRMWPFPKRRQAVPEAHLELVSQIHGVLQRVKLLEDGLAALEAAHERLRGRFYATRPADSGSKPLTKAEILANHFRNKQQ